MQFAQFVQVASDRLIEGAPSGVYNLCGAGKFLVSILYKSVYVIVFHYITKEVFLAPS